MNIASLKPKRVLLKLSGELLLGEKNYGVDPETINRLAEDIAEVYERGIEVAVVIGGGNIFRGRDGISQGIDQCTSDYMGMLATVMNGLALSSALERLKVTTRVMSAISMNAVSEPFIRSRALRHISLGRVLIFTGGTGNPYFTTDTAAALRASEMNCDLLLKGTKVPGVFAEDPTVNPDAKHFPHITYSQILADDLKVMDAAAIALTRETNLPIAVFRAHDKGAFNRVLSGEGVYTMVTRELPEEADPTVA
ncbi:UMP kinase [Alphaproteobacteria bacterium]|nr:UMP kinase [Alphaproteobacteria bacterium]